MSSHRRRYNLRKRGEGKRYKEEDSQTEEEEEDDDDLEEDDVKSSSRRQQGDTSHKSHSDRSCDSSTLSSSASNSFSYHEGHSPSVGKSGGKPGGLYPTLPSGSPTTTRRNVHTERSPHSSPRNPSPHRSHKKGHFSPDSAKPSQKKMEQDSIFGFPKQLICMIAIFLLICCLVYKKFSSSSSNELAFVKKSNPFQEFSEKVDELKIRFPNETPRFWKVVKASALHVLNAEGEASYPAVLLMIGEKRNNALSADIAHAIGQAFENALRSSPDVASLNLIMHPGKDTADSQKLALDKWLTDKFSNYSTVILNHIEALEPEAALLFHGYCDGDNAPFKNAMLILQLSLEEQVENQQAAETALQKLWLSKLEEDKVGALLSRVANNIALVSVNKKNNGRL